VGDEKREKRTERVSRESEFSAEFAELLEGPATALMVCEVRSSRERRNDKVWKERPLLASLWCCLTA
jgi:hypothetical protein